MTTFNCRLQPETRTVCLVPYFIFIALTRWLDIIVAFLLVLVTVPVAIEPFEAPNRDGWHRDDQEGHAATGASLVDRQIVERRH